MANHKVRLLTLSLTCLFTLASLVAACGGDEADSASAVAGTNDTSEPTSASASKSFPNQIIAPHFVDSYPLHGDTLVQAAQEVVLNFNFNLHSNSAIEVTRDGQPVGVGPVTISENELSMRATIQESPPDGIYQANYMACWPDGSCHEGSMAFTVDSASLAEYVDLQGQTEITIPMVDGQRFDPARIIISPGATVTWINQDSVAHFVNTDPHPSHNVLEELNSSGINPGESYTYTFTKPGAWGYHCSAHFGDGMIAQVLVQ